MLRQFKCSFLLCAVALSIPCAPTVVSAQDFFTNRAYNLSKSLADASKKEIDDVASEGYDENLAIGGVDMADCYDSQASRWKAIYLKISDLD